MMEKENIGCGPRVDVKNMCRMCAKPGHADIDLFGSAENNRTLAVRLEELTTVSVHHQDVLSTMICVKCLDSLDMFETMKTKVLKAQATQQALVSKKKTKGRTGDTLKKLKMSSGKSALDDDFEENEGKGTIKMNCRVCLKNFTPISFVNHECDTSDLIPCKKCKMNFRTLENLEEHEVTIHKSAKPGKRSSKAILCVHCKLYFDNAELLESHLRKIGHQKLHIFNCNYCTKFYTKQADCLEHVKTDHSEKIEIKKEKE